MRNCTTLDSFAAFAEGPDGGPSVSITQPASVSGNTLLDSISGIVASITPAATNAVTSKITGGTQTSLKPAVIPASTSSVMPLVIVGGAALIGLYFLMRK
jgi:hypothetical protein